MNVEVGDGFASVRTVVDDQSETVFGEALILGDLGSGEQKVADYGLILAAGFGDAITGGQRPSRDRLRRRPRVARFLFESRVCRRAVSITSSTTASATSG